MMMRWHLINAMLARSTRSETIYLEIGTQTGECLQRVDANVKWGVDPDNRAQRFTDAFFKQRSDEFFAIRKKLPTFDVIFIDGLHHHDQVLRDVDNALPLLAEGGCIILHDCNPQTERAQRVPRPKGQKIWNGDCWKAVVALRQRDDVDVCVVNTDHGLGIVLPRASADRLEGVTQNVSELAYEDLVAERVKFLNLIREDDWQSWCDECLVHPRDAPAVVAAEETKADVKDDEIVVVTAIFGDRDKLTELDTKSPGHRYVCFTDKERDSSSWEIVKLSVSSNPRLAARRIKTLIHEYVQAKRTVWVDGSMRVVGDMRSLFTSPADVAAFAHPERDCVYKEIQACSDLRRAEKNALKRQKQRYRQAGFPDRGGLYATGLLARRMTPAVRKLGERWWRELNKTTLRDQISFPILLKECGVRCHVLQGGSIYSNRFVRYVGHSGRDRPERSVVAAALPKTTEGRPPVFTFIAYDERMDLGAAYNRHMELLPDDAWGCFIDHDAMFTTSSWYPQLLDVIEDNPGAGLLTAMTNRVNNITQVIEAQHHDVVRHRERGTMLQSDLGTFVEDVTKGPLISGVLMCLPKHVWDTVGGFKSGFLGVDNQMHLDVARAGYQVLLMRGLYVYHWYRAFGDTAHLDRLTPQHKVQPR